MHPEIFATCEKDFENAITNQVIKYNCVNCGKLVERKFRRTRLDSFKRMLCLECNMSYLAKIDPGKFQRSLESNRANHGGKLSAELNMNWNKAGVEKNKSVEGRKIISERIKSNPEILESKHIDYFGIRFDSIPELCVFIYCKMFGIPIIRNVRNIGFEYFDSLGYIHTTYPDFIINGSIVEIKGKHFYNTDGTWTQPFKNPRWSDETYSVECDKMEKKRQCLINNGVLIFKDTDPWIKLCINTVCFYGFDPKSFIVKNPKNTCYGYTPYNVSNEEYQKPIYWFK